MNSKDIANAIARVPDLAYFGIGVPASDGSQLLDSSRICTEVCRWLNWIAKTKAMNPHRSSYGLKHVAERAIREYVSNGEFIVAAIHCGFPFEIISRSPNVRFGISERSLKLTEGWKNY